MGNNIKMNTDTYTTYVSEMKNQSKLMLASSQQPVVPDEIVLKNIVIPDYATANEEAIDTIKRLQAVLATTGKLMDNIKENYDKQVDENLSNQMNDANGTSGG
ncbi:hypothetical protein [Butyrivibrio proteoclasticus]|uniref:hypothetical protein n=1 Tax=Butyrivibrio proteoclasticus TaxID=43305 RepID=UPI00047C092B|nr:hypothetical protein [Butyrivibrio proteoclasticus]